MIDASEWTFDGWTSAAVSSALDGLLERLGVATERGESVWIGDDLQTRTVVAGRSFWELWSPESPLQLAPELRQEMSAYLGRAPRYVEAPVWPSGFEDWRISVGGDPPLDNPDAAWVHHSVRSGVAMACLGLNRRGVFSTTTAAGTADVHWVGDERGHRDFFRTAIDVERDTESSLEKFAPHAFPDIHFLDGVWRGLSDFEGGYARTRFQLRSLFATLDDHGHWIFTAPPPAKTEADPPGVRESKPGDQLVQLRFALHSLDVAPEKPNVREKRNCREARERMLGRRTLYLEWHAKLEPQVNRVHINAPIGESGERVIVGIFHAHLPLPGDG